MKKLLALIISASVFLFSCSQSESKKAEKDKNSYETIKENLHDKEVKSPQFFLAVTGHDKRNIIGQTVVKGIVTNKATVAKYKDIEVKLDFYSKTKTLLETDKETVYEILAPGQSKNFKTKYFAPKGTDSVALTIVSAKVAEN